jgi:hypothetical protein
MSIKNSCFLFFNLLYFFAFSQSNYRLKAQYSIKEIDTSKTQKISIGELFLDKNTKCLRFVQKFPETKTYILQDSSMTIDDGKKKSSIVAPKGLIEVNIYSIILSGKLQDFGLKSFGYQLKSVKEEEGFVIMNYAPPASAKNNGKVELVKKNGVLDSFIVYDLSGKTISQTYFREYLTINGLQIPQKIIQIVYFGTKESKKITTLKQIKLDEVGNDLMYKP